MYGDAGNAPEPSIDYCIALFIRKIFQNRRCAAHPKLAHPYAGCETDDSDRYPCSIPRHLEPFSAACTASLRARRIGSYCLRARSLCNLTEKGSRQAFRTAALATLRLLAVLDVLSASARLASAAVRNAWVSLAPVSPRRAVPGILMLQIQQTRKRDFQCIITQRCAQRRPIDIGPVAFEPMGHFSAVDCQAIKYGGQGQTVRIGDQYPALRRRI